MMVPILFLAFFLLFFLNFKLGQKLATASASMARIGSKLLTQKEQQLADSPLFGPLRKAIDRKKYLLAMLTICPLVLLKSAAFYYAGLVLLIPLLLVAQGLMMGALFKAYSLKYNQTNNFLKVIYWQLSSHLIIGAFGFAKGMVWLLGIDLSQSGEPLWLTSIFNYVVLAVIWGVVAAYLEVRLLMEY